MYLLTGVLIYEEAKEISLHSFLSFSRGTQITWLRGKINIIVVTYGRHLILRPSAVVLITDYSLKLALWLRSNSFHYKVSYLSQLSYIFYHCYSCGFDSRVDYVYIVFSPIRFLYYSVFSVISYIYSAFAWTLVIRRILQLRCTD